MFYTYVLKEKTRHHFYIGSTKNLQRRLEEHRANTTKSTRSRDWELYCYFAFSQEVKARNFESYLKTGSGRAFAKKHFEFQFDEALA